MSVTSAANAASGGRSRPSQCASSAETLGRICGTSRSVMPRASMAPIGATKHASRKRKSGSTRAAARNCSLRALFFSARRSRAPESALLGDPGIEALVQLVQVLEPELVVDVDGGRDVLRRGREIRQHVLVDKRGRGLGGDAIRDLRRQVLLVLRIVDE